MTELAALDCPICGDAVSAIRTAPSTRLRYVEPCGCTVSPATVRELEVARDTDRGRVVLSDGEQPTAWIESDHVVEVSQLR